MAELETSDLEGLKSLPYTLSHQGFSAGKDKEGREETRASIPIRHGDMSQTTWFGTS